MQLWTASVELLALEKQRRQFFRPSASTWSRQENSTLLALLYRPLTLVLLTISRRERKSEKLLPWSSLPLPRHVTRARRSDWNCHYIAGVSPGVPHRHFPFTPSPWSFCYSLKAFCNSPAVVRLTYDYPTWGIVASLFRPISLFFLTCSISPVFFSYHPHLLGLFRGDSDFHDAMGATSPNRDRWATHVSYQYRCPILYGALWNYLAFLTASFAIATTAADKLAILASRQWRLC
jgi:hypothetical protein